MKTIEIGLGKATLLENGTIKAVEGNNKVIISLHNSGIPNETLVSSRDAEFEDGVEFDFEQELVDQPHLMTLFRAEAYNKIYLEVEVTTIVEPTTAAKVLFQMLKGVSESAIGLIPGGDVVTAVAKIGSEAIFKAIKPEDNIQIIGYGRAELDINNLESEISIDLIVPKDVKMSRTTYKPRAGQQKGRGVRLYKEKKLPKDKENGVISLTIKEL